MSAPALVLLVLLMPATTMAPSIQPTKTSRRSSVRGAMARATTMLLVLLMLLVSVTNC
jgi:hypothetical protein